MRDTRWDSYTGALPRLGTGRCDVGEQKKERENVWRWAEKYDERYREYRELINEQLGGNLDSQALQDIYAADRRVQEARTEFIHALDVWARLTEQGHVPQPEPRVGPTYG